MVSANLSPPRAAFIKFSFLGNLWILANLENVSTVDCDFHSNKFSFALNALSVSGFDIDFRNCDCSDTEHELCEHMRRKF